MSVQIGPEYPLHECANLAGIRDIFAVAGRDSFDRAGTGSFGAVFGL